MPRPYRPDTLEYIYLKHKKRMTTPERSVKEIVEEFDSIFVSHNLRFDDKPLQSGSLTDDIKNWFTQTLKAERQSVIHHWNKAEQRLDGTIEGAAAAIEQYRSYLTQLDKS